MEKQNIKILSDDETKRLIYSFIYGRGDKGVTEEETVKVVEWAANAKLGSMLLEWVLEGELFIDYDGEEVVFGRKAGKDKKLT